jgi:predicted transcriptional regulator
MIPSLNIDHSVEALRLDDSINQALDLLDEYKLYHLPVIDGQEYLGYVSEEILLEARGTLIGDLVIAGERIFTSDSESLYSSIKKMAQHNLSSLAVLDSDNQYLGAITTHSVFKTFSEISSIRSNGGVFSVILSQNDYSLAELSRILEANGYKIISVELITVPETPTMVEVILKVNTHELTSAIATMERYGYQVNLRFGKNAYDQDDKQRINEILNYLNL